ncbi:MAG: hypothetical protein HON47_00955 [Candidatus Diapherotrites archaeon]|jgi:ribosomal protein L31E|uniref:Large ribosomal subunit protein eL31 n=1 Tax=Candidatus Iainarchaeum sp. TaxID=3101447 RepID=A0A8T5GDC1_9ARCH|nr:hypothetical protein [Candidatus Diapherotrites archaeon]MBT7241395.1 hypothetical protein [Candidatus Diapherotrites archaeon]
MAKEYKEKTITINLSKVFLKPVTKRAKGAIFMVKKKVTKETRASEVLLSNKVNETIWENGMFRCPRKITVKIVNDKGKARVYLPDEKVELKKEEKKKATGLKAKAEEIAGKKETKVETPKEEKKETKTEEKVEAKAPVKEEAKVEEKKEEKVSKEK